MQRISLWVVLGLVILASASPSFADESPESASSLLEAVAGLDRSLEEIAQLLDHLVRHQQVELVLRRIEIRVRRMAPLEEELRRAERRLMETKSDINRYETMMEDLEDKILEEARQGVDPADSGARRMKEDVERELLVRNEELESLERRAQDIELDLAHGRREIEVLDDVLKEALESVTDR